MTKERLDRLLIAHGVYRPAREGPPLSTIKLDPEHCLPPGLFPIRKTLFGAELTVICLELNK